jgi:hypothetical protein
MIELFVSAVLMFSGKVEREPDFGPDQGTAEYENWLRSPGYKRCVVK